MSKEMEDSRVRELVRVSLLRDDMAETLKKDYGSKIARWTVAFKILSLPSMYSLALCLLYPSEALELHIVSCIIFLIPLLLVSGRIIQLRIDRRNLLEFDRYKSKRNQILDAELWKATD